MPIADTKRRVVITMENELADRLQELAAVERRTVSAQVSFLVETYLERATLANQKEPVGYSGHSLKTNLAE